MRFRTLGRVTGLPLSEMILGGASFGQSAGHGADPATVNAMLEAYTAAGGNVIDTSDRYQLGESERLIGAFLAGRRDAIVLASKYSFTASPGTASPSSVGNHRRAMVQSVEASLRRLGTDRIDLYFLHLDDGLTPTDEIVRGLDDLVRAGKIIHAGLSNFPAWRVATAATVAELRGCNRIAAVQLEYSLLERTPERELLPMADAFGLGVLGYSPLAGGMLTGKYRRGETGRATAVAGSVPHQDRGQASAVIDAVEAIAADLGASPGQVALAWVMQRGILPILGARSLAQLTDNLAAASLVLSPEHVHRLDEVSAVPAGYPHELLAAHRPHAVPPPLVTPR